MKFLLTGEVGRLARWLRILGFDARTQPRTNASACVLAAIREDRVLVTRNHRIGRRHAGTIVCLESNDVKEQLGELARRLGVRWDAAKMFTRCIVCNAALETVEKPRVRDRVPAFVFETQEIFHQCPSCLRVFWRGTHWGHVTHVLQQIEKG
jgi:uncharacterized protein with PIN domain